MRLRDSEYLHKQGGALEGESRIGSRGRRATVSPIWPSRAAKPLALSKRLFASGAALRTLPNFTRLRTNSHNSLRLMARNCRPDRGEGQRPLPGGS